MSQRSIAFETRGQRHGPIVRLISPDALGDRLKPFIFLDYFDSAIEPGFGFPMHPHSGIATLTWQPGSDVQYRDTTGKNGILKAGGLEWMNAGGGAWHQGTLLGSGHVTGFQLWVPMPPGIEDGPAFGQYVEPEAVPSLSFPGSNVKLLLGRFATDGEESVSAIDPHHDMNYLTISLDPGASFEYRPPQQHDVAWAFPYEGAPRIEDRPFAEELLVFEGEGPIRIEASTGPARLLLGSARRHPHSLVLGRSSVHTNAASLAAAEARIASLRPA